MNAAMTLATHDIHVWISFERSLDEPVLRKLRPLLQPAELERVDKAYSEEVRLRFLAARAMQRTVLARYAGVDPTALRFVTGEHGKPALAAEFEPLGLHFNVTHTEGLVGIAVSRHRDVGFDAENLLERTTALKLARRYFTAEEARNLEALPLTEQPARFYSLWTLKEAWMKATGRGIAAGLDNAAFSLDDNHRVAGLDFAACDASDWRFWQFTPTPEHILALALRAPGATRDVSVSTFEWRPGEMADPL
ncbi:MAG: 4'-phosphopantetheinyl transferase superfamily protein [Steroidobacteraceae bacterium]|nr:4'-phosphopantetheinyl transferase superfamily protein [Steroidobacteraceae bacterium]